MLKNTICLFYFALLSVATYSQSQLDYLKKNSAGDYSVGKITATEKRPNDKFVEVATKKWPVKFQLEGDRCNEIIILRAGVVEEKYSVDVPGYPAYYSNGSTRITFIENTLYYYKWVNSEPQISYFLSLNADDVKIKDLDAAHAKLSEYLKNTFSGQSGARSNMVAEKNAQVEKEKLAHSIKDKDIKKLEFVWITPSSEIGLQTKVKYGIVATDGKGNQYKTPSLGGKTPYEDYELIVIGAQPGDEFLAVENTCALITGDKITVTAKSKFNPSQQVSSSIPISYSTPVNIAYRGEPGCGTAMYARSGSSGGSGKNLDVYVTEKSGLVLMEIKSSYDGKTLHQIKVQPGVPVTIDVCGGNGCSGSSSSTSTGGNGGNGGNGGTVNVYKTNDSIGSSLTILNRGGNGGNGGKGASAYQKGTDGSSGNDGSINEYIKTFNLNF